MSDTLTEIMRELIALRRRVERMEALEFVRSQDTPTLAGLNVGTASGAPTGEITAPDGCAQWNRLAWYPLDVDAPGSADDGAN